MSRAIKSNLVFIKRKQLVGVWNISTTYSSNNYVFQLDDLPNYTEFTNLFEQYKINAVKLTFLPSYTGSDANQATVAGTTFQFAPRIYTMIDKDGSPSIGTENAMLQRNDCRMIANPYKTFSIYIRKPNVQFEVGSGLGFAQAAPRPSPWLDCDNYAVNHHGAGVGGVLPSGSSSTAGLQYQVVATYYMAFKGAT